MYVRDYYEVDVVKGVQVKDIIRTRLAATIAELEKKYSKLDPEIIYGPKLESVDYIHLTVIIDLVNGDPKSPLTQSHYFEYNSELLSAIKQKAS